MTVNKTNKPKPPAGGKKVFDVSRPGKSFANPTSKPVIVSNTPPVKDSQISLPERTMLDAKKKVIIQPVGGTDDTANGDSNNTPSGAPDLEQAIAAVLTSPMKTITPPKDETEKPTGPPPLPPTPEEPPAPDSPPPSPEQTNPASSIPEATPPPVPTPTPPPAPVAEQKPEEDADDIGRAVLDATVAHPAPDNASPEKPEPEKSVDSKGTFEVPSGAEAKEELPVTFDIEPIVVSSPAKKRHAVEAILIVFILLLLLVLLNVLLDADILKMDAIPHTNFL